MAQGNFIPQRGKIYKADDYNWLGKKFTIEDTVYQFVKFPAQFFGRENTILAVNDAYEASIWHGVATKCGGVLEMDVNCVDGNEDLYGLIVAYGDTNADVAARAASCVYVQAAVVGWDNGVARAVNAATAVGAGLVKFIPTTQVLNLCATADQNYTAHVAGGDVGYTNIGHYGPIAAVVNGSSMIMAAWVGASANDHSYAATISHAVGALQNFGKKAAFTCGTYYGRYINNEAISALQPVPSINVCTAATIFHVNTCVCGKLFKVGDAVKLTGAATATGTCTFIITSINNTKAFTVNVGPAAESYGLVGTFANINAYYAAIRIDGNN